MNHFAAEIIAQDHLASLRAQAAESRRARDAQRPGIGQVRRSLVVRALAGARRRARLTAAGMTAH